MDSIQALTTLLGWCTVINIGVLLVATILLVGLRSQIMRIHSGLFGLDQADLSRAYFQYLAQYKTVVVVFNLVPYLSLMVMA
ncbi:MAG: hypothetical protein R6W97_09670 [Thiobacillus sp.]